MLTPGDELPRADAIVSPLRTVRLERSADELAAKPMPTAFTRREKTVVARNSASRGVRFGDCVGRTREPIALRAAVYQLRAKPMDGW